MDLGVKFKFRIRFTVRVKVGLRLMLNARVEVRGESKDQRLEDEFGQCLFACVHRSHTHTDKSNACFFLFILQVSLNLCKDILLSQLCLNKNTTNRS